MRLNILIGVVVVAILTLGGWWYFNQLSVPAASTTEDLSAQVPDSDSPKPSAETGNTAADWSTYTSNQYKFQIQYPAEYRVVEKPAGDTAIAGFVMPHPDRAEGVMVIKAYVRNNGFSSFDAYKNDMQTNLIRNLFKGNNSSASEAEIDAQVLQQTGHYSFREETIGGSPVIFHKRDFLGIAGGIYEMHVGISGNQILVFSSEAGEEFLDKFYHSFRILN